MIDNIDKIPTSNEIKLHPSIQKASKYESIDQMKQRVKEEQTDLKDWPYSMSELRRSRTDATNEKVSEDKPSAAVEEVNEAKPISPPIEVPQESTPATSAAEVAPDKASTNGSSPQTELDMNGRVFISSVEQQLLGKPQHFLKGDTMIVGRGEDCDLRIVSPDVLGSFISRRHMEIRREGNDFYVRDLDSVNGVTLDQVRLDRNKEYRLHNGEKLQLADKNLIFRVAIIEQDQKKHFSLVEERVGGEFEVIEKSQSTPDELTSVSSRVESPQKQPVKREVSPQLQKEREQIKYILGEKVVMAEDPRHHPLQDAAFSLPNGFIGVFDGVSKSEGKDEAEICKKIAQQDLASLSPLTDKRECMSALTVLWQYMQKRLEAATSQDGKKRETTAALAQVVVENGKKVLLAAHSGDSRVYVIRKDGTIVDITLDHKVSNQLMRKDDRQRAWQLQRQHNEANQHDKLNNRISQALSNNADVKPEFTTYELQPDDIGYFCATDGLHDSLKTSQMNQVLTEKKKYLGLPIDFRSVKKRVEGNILNLVSKVRDAATKRSERYKDDDIGIAFALFAAE